MGSRSIWAFWNGTFLLIETIPLAIFWNERSRAFDDAPALLTNHVVASAVYAAMIALSWLWLGSRGRASRVFAAGALGCAVGSVALFEAIARAAVREAGLSGLGMDLAIALMIWLSAITAASIVLSTVVSLVQHNRARPR